ncbi:amino acid adenylation domain-containing protein [Streptococcus sp. Marseille-Q7156]
MVVKEQVNSSIFNLSAPQMQIYQMVEGGYDKASTISASMISKKYRDEESMRYSLRTLFESFSIFRTFIKIENGKPLQWIDKNYQLREDEIDHLIFKSVEDFNKWVNEEAQKPLPLDEPLFVFMTVCVNGQYGMFIRLSHIISDGLSLYLIANYLDNIYTAKYIENRELAIEDYPYMEIIEDGEKYRGSNKFLEDIKFWRELIKQGTSFISLSDKKREAYKTIRHEFKYSVEFSRVIEDFCKANNISEFVLFFGLLGMFVSAMTGEKDFFLGTNLLNRSNKQRKAIGMYVTTNLLRCHYDEEMTCQEFFKVCKKSFFNTMRHGQVTYSEIMEKCQDLVSGNLVDIMYNYQKGEFSDDSRVATWHHNGHSQQSMSISVRRPNRDALVMDIDYDPTLYSYADINQMYNVVNSLMEQMIENPDVKIKEIQFCTKEDEQKIINCFNATGFDFCTGNRTIIDFFEESVEKYPNKAAVIFGDKILTYKEFNQKVNILANKLRNLGVTRGSVVAVNMDRSDIMLAGIFAIVKAGGAYMPISTAFPTQRIEYMLNDSESIVLLYDGNVGKPEIDKEDIIMLDISDSSIWKGEENDENNLEHINIPNDPIYVIYTSGTTGNPKGVINIHKGLLNRILWMNRRYPIISKDVILQKTVFTFDVSVWEIFWWSMFGASVVLPKQGDEKDPLRIAEEIQRNKVTVTHFVPTMLDNFLEYIISVDKQNVWSHLKYVFSSGETLHSTTVNTFYQTTDGVSYVKLINVYGPTEASIDVSYYDCKPKEKIIPIGKPIDNTKIFITKGTTLCGIGIPGEVLITGVGLALGYLNNDQLTNDKFIDNPFGEGKAYKTGDCARWLPDGNIQYLKRFDTQIKIHGQRLEIGEIEKALLSIDGVKEGAVICKKNEKNENVLYGYYTSGKEIKPADVQKILTQILPGYMIPRYMIQIDNLPFTEHGKLDRKSLPDILQVTKADYIQPQTKSQIALVKAIETVLDLDKIGLDDDFISLGGDSISGIRVISELRKEGMTLSVRDLIEGRIIRVISTYIKTEQHIITFPQIKEGIINGTPLTDGFMKYGLDKPEHYNQAVSIELDEIYPEKIKQAVDIVVKTHDILRTIVRKVNGVMKLYIRNVEEKPLYSYLEEDIDKGRLDEIQETFNLFNGPLFKVIVQRKEKRMIFIGHHLIVDAISWGIIITDFLDAYNAVCSELVPVIQPPTTPFAAVADMISDRIERGYYSNEKAYWYKNIKNIEPLLFSKNKSVLSFDVVGRKEFTVIKSISNLEQWCDKSNLSVESVLLTALARGYKKNVDFKKYKQSHIMSVLMESHGRMFGETLRLERTVGWFTVFYPLNVVATDNSFIDDVARNCHVLETVPSKGMGFAPYMMNADSNKLPNIIFNYLGESLRYKGIKVRTDNCGKTIADENLGENIMVNIFKKGNIYETVCEFDRTKYDVGEIESWINGYVEELEELCTITLGKQEKTLVIPAHFGFTDLTPEEYQDIQKIYAAESVYALTATQKGLLLHLLNEEKTGDYQIQIVTQIPTDLEDDIIRASLKRLSEKYDVFRTVINTSYSEPCAIVLKNSEIRYSVYEEKISDAGLDGIISMDRGQGFDLEKDSLARVCKITTESGDTLLLWNFNHIIMDGWSLPIVLNDFVNNCLNVDKSQSSNICTYDRYATELNKRDVLSMRDYWRRIMSGAEGGAVIEPLNKLKLIHKPGEETLKIDKKTLNKLEKFCHKNALTLNSLFEVTVGILLNQYTRQEDIIFGALVSGRQVNMEHIESLVGMCAHVVPVRLNISEKSRTLDVMHELQQQTLESFQYDYGSLSDMHATDKEGNNLLHIIYAFENYDLQMKDNIDDFRVITSKEQTEYDMALRVMPRGNTYDLQILWHGDCVSEGQPMSILQHWLLIIDTLAESGDVFVNEIPLSTLSERKNIISTISETEDVIWPVEETVASLFKKAVVRWPERRAVVFGSRTIDYQTLDYESDVLAAKLIDSGIGTGDFVALFCERSIEMIVGIYAVLKTGAAYVPINTIYPQERVDYILNDCKPKAILYYGCEAPEGSSSLTIEIELGNHEDFLKVEDVVLQRTHEVQPQDVLYVIYTSGTTGNPKGVLVQNKNLVRLLFNSDFVFDFTEKDVWTMFHAYGFDFSVWEMYGAGLRGGCLVIVPEETAQNSIDFVELIAKEKVTVLNQVPSAFYNLMSVDVPEKTGSIRYLIFGGEALRPEKLRGWHETHPDTSIINMYGITETTVHVTYQGIGDEEISNSDDAIGVAIPTTQIYLERDGRLCGTGIPGEICVAGSGVAKGYLNRQELTEMRFIDNPYGSGKMYYSGDLAKWDDEGRLYYLGRIDQQVQIRGFRVELGDVEHAMIQIGGIKECVVIDNESEDGNIYLAAYYTSTEELKSADIRNQLKEMVPGYMIPTVFIRIEQLPTTVNGKLDKKKLREITMVSDVSDENKVPENEKEIILANAYSNILGIDMERIGQEADFFSLGGDSIKALRVVTEVRNFGYELKIRDILSGNILSELAEKMAFHDERAIRYSMRFGEIKDTPIVKQFFEKDYADKNHYNQALMFEEQNINVDAFRNALYQVLDHHEIFKAVVMNDHLYQNKELSDNHIIFEVYEDMKDRISEIPQICTELQSGLDIEKGPMIIAAIFKTEEIDFIMIAVHHLLIDGVSWRILLNDLRRVYEENLLKCKATFSERTASYTQWADEVDRIAKSNLLDDQIPYWTSMVEKVTEHYKGIVNKSTDVDSFSPVIERQHIIEDSETEEVLKKCAAKINGSVEDILLGTMILAYGKVMGNREDEFCFELESHGREGLPTELHLDQTIGWFTAIYPCVVKLTKDSLNQVLYVKEQKKNIPGKGVGYSVLSMAGKVENVTAPVRFNYLGDNRDTTEFKMSQMPAGDAVSAENISDQICWDMICIDGMLSYKLVTRKNNFLEQMSGNENVIDLWFEEFEIALNEVIKAIEAEERALYTPHDYGVELSLDEFKEISDNYDFEDMYPLMSTQAGMLYQKIAEDNTGEYVIQSCFAVTNAFDFEAAEKALELLGKRYPVLRTRILYKNSIKPVQIIDKDLKLEYNHIFCKEDEIETVLVEDIRRGFELDMNSLLRLTVITLEDNSIRLIWTMHHIIMDGWCLSLIFGTYLEYYKLLVQGENVEVNNSTEKSFGEYVHWLGKQNTLSEISFWKEQIEDYENEKRIPEIGGDQDTDNLLLICDTRIDENVVQKVTAYTENNNVTANAIFETVWSVVLSQYTGSNDVIFGIVNSGRNIELSGIENTVGLFIHTLPLRIMFGNTTTVSELIKEVHTKTLEVSENSIVELGEILKLNVAGNGLFDTLFVFENYYMDEKLTASDEFKVLSSREQTNYGITFRVHPDDGYRIEILANPKKFSKDFLGMLLERAEYILRVMMETPEICVDEIPMCNEAEEHTILNKFNDTNYEYPMAGSVINLFEDMVALYPDVVALRYKGEELTYREFNKRVNILAHELMRRGYGHGDYIGVCIERSFEMMIGIFAVVKSGAAYIPIDTSYPEARIQFILSNADACCVLVNEEMAEKVNYGEIDKFIIASDITIDTFTDSTKEEEENPDVKHEGDDPIYVIYTSGTTGQPKGVVNLNKGLLNRIRWMQKEYPIGLGDVILQKTVYTFDVSVWELFWWSMQGATLHLLEQGDEKDPRRIIEGVIEGGVTTIHFVPTVLDLFLWELDRHKEFVDKFMSLKYVFSSGEALKPDTVKKFHSIFETSGPKLINVYGPTEASIDVSVYECSRPEDLVPIGKPIDNIRLYIQNNSRICNIGMPGELVITGVGVAQGYINNPEQTSDKFRKNLYGEGNMYYTGDLCSWMPDGNIRYHHRIDNQIKIHGQRVELGEIESAMRNVEGIYDAAVIITTRGKDVILCGFYVSDMVLDTEEIKISLSEKLAGYMIPNLLVQIDKIPFTSHGKLDRKTLTDLVPETVDKRGYEAPVGEKEEFIAKIFEEVLVYKNVSRTDDFYSLGGDSIKVMRVLSRIRAEHYMLSIKDIMKYRTVELIASHLKAEEEETIKEQRIGAITPLPIQEQFFDWDIDDCNYYNQAMMLRFKFEPDVDRLKEAFDSMTEIHSMLRCFWKEGTPTILPFEKNKFFTFEEVDLMDIAEQGESLETIILEKNNSIQQGINIETGPLMRAVLYKMGSEHYELFICIHHLVMDAYSWRVLISDLELAYRHENQEMLSIPREANEFCDWSEAVISSVNDPEACADFWNCFIKDSKEYQKPDRKNRTAGIREMRRELSEDITKKLRQNMVQNFNVNVEELILAGVKLALNNWETSDIRCIDIENQGRMIDGIKCANDRTIGWFTMIYPFAIEKSHKNVLNTILSVKEEKASIHQHMHEYGVLYSLGLGEEHIQKRSAILFNYLGVLDDEYHSNEMFMASEYPIGNCMDLCKAPVYPITVDCSITKNCLGFDVKYDTGLYSDEEIAELLELLSENMRSIVEIGNHQEEVIVTRSDLGEAALTMSDEDFDELDTLLTGLIQEI